MSWWARLRDRIPVRWAWLAAALITGALLHLTSVLAMAQLTPSRALQVLDHIDRVNEMVVLPAVTPEHQVLPYMMPGDRYALCRYDLSKGPVSIRLTFGDDIWTLALMSGSGGNFYTLSAAELDRRDVELMLVQSEEGQSGSLPISGDSSTGTVITVSVPQPIGLAVVHAPVRSPVYAGDTDRLLSLSACTARQPRPST